MLKKLLAGLAIVVVALVMLGFLLPDKTHIERAILVDAPQEEVFAIASDLNQQERWSPWLEYDPAAKTEVTGAGVGQKMRWTSKKLGNGSQEITALDPPSRIDTALEFEGHGRAMSAMTMSPEQNGTRVVWSFDCNMREAVPLWMQPLSTYMGFFMEGMLGKDYEKGLANLKREAEAP
jgi:hypothetical protein